MKKLLLAAVAALTLGELAHAQAAPKFQPPTATEFFKLRGECAKLAQKKLADDAHGSDWIDSVQSQYGSDDTGRCYVAIYGYIRTDSHCEPSDIDPDHWRKGDFAWYLYDGQTDDMLAYAERQNGEQFGAIFDPDYHGDGTMGLEAAHDYEVTHDYIASKLGQR